MFRFAPTVEANPNERAPLVAIVRFATDRPVAAALDIDDGRKRRRVTFGADRDPERGLPVIGMRADTEHRISVTAGTAGPVALT